MKKKRGLPIVAGAAALVILLGLYFLLKNYNDQSEQQESQEEEETGQEIAAVDEDTISSLSFGMSGEDVTWVQEDGTWSLSDDSNFPVDQEKIGNLTSQLVSVEATRILENVENLSEYGLDAPYKVIRVEETDGNSLTISVGNQNDSTGDCYIYLNDDTGTVYTVSGSLRTAFSGDFYDFAVGEEYPEMTSSSITQVAVAKENGSYTVQTEGDFSTGWQVTDDSGNVWEADETQAGTLQSTVSGLSFSDYYSYDCQDLSQYGLDQPQAEITVQYMVEEETDTEDTAQSDDGEEDTSSDSESQDTASDGSEDETTYVDKEMKLYVGSLSDDGNYYVRLEGSNEVHGITQDSLSTLLEGTSLDYLRMSVANINISDLDRLEVTYEDETHTLQRRVRQVAAEEEEDASEEDSQEEGTDEETETTTETTYYVDGQEVDSQDFTDFYSQAGAMTYQSRTQEDTASQEPELTLDYYDTEGNHLQVTYSVQDANFYAAADSEGNYGVVNKMNVSSLIEDFKTLLEKAGK